MTTKVVNALKYLGLVCLIISISTSCDKEIENIGVNLVENGSFNSNSESYQILSSTTNIEKVPASRINQYLIGSYSDNNFGKLKASLVTQLALPVTGNDYNYGENPTIDSVIISIPYQATKKENYANGKPQYSIDSVFGDSDVEFKVGIYELKTFLNNLDPQDPTKNNVYYSNKEFQKSALPLYLENFKINPDDTVSYISRRNFDGTIYKTDTIKNTDGTPSMKFPLNKELVKQLFVDNAAGPEFSSFENFANYFRGLFIETSEVSNQPSHLVSLSMADSKMTIYYSNDVDNVRTTQSHTFIFGVLKSNILERDYTNSNLIQNSENRLFVQGASGSEANITLFNNNELDQIRTKNWLINDASLTFFIDQSSSSEILPEQLYIYNMEENLQIKDMMTEGLSVIGGNLQRDADGNPEKYVFKITDYISDLVKFDDAVELVKLGIRVFNPTDAPTDPLDVNMRHFSWNPKGVVLYNHNTTNLDKKAQLNITYTELNN